MRVLSVSWERDEAVMIWVVSNISFEFFHSGRGKAAYNPVVPFSRVSNDRSKAVRIICTLWVIVRMYVKD